MANPSQFTVVFTEKLKFLLTIFKSFFFKLKIIFYIINACFFLPVFIYSLIFMKQRSKLKFSFFLPKSLLFINLLILRKVSITYSNSVLKKIIRPLNLYKKIHQMHQTLPYKM